MVDGQGTAWLAYIEWDGKQDSLCLAKQTDDGLQRVLTIGKPEEIVRDPEVIRAYLGDRYARAQ